MEGGGSLIALPLGLMFIFSGLFINGLQVISVLFILPFSRRAYRVVNMIMMEALWSELVWLLDWWAGVKVKVYTPRETSEHLGELPNLYDVFWYCFECSFDVFRDVLHA